MGTKEIVGGQNITVMADYLPEEVNFDSYDMVILPGGGLGHQNLKKCPLVEDMIIGWYNAFRGKKKWKLV